MTERSDRPTVGRKELVDALIAAAQAAEAGPKAVVLAGEDGSGRRTAVLKALAGLQEADKSPTVVRLHFMPGEDGVRHLMRTFGSAVTAVARSKGLDRSAVGLLREAAEASDDPRQVERFKNVCENIESLMSAGLAPGQQALQLPADNPYLALLDVFEVLGPRGSWIFDLHNCGLATSPAFWIFLGALVGRARARNWKVLFLLAPGRNLFGESASEGKEEAAQPGPLACLRALFPDAEAHLAAPLDQLAIQELLDDGYRPHNFPAELADRLQSMSGGSPKVLHELLDALEQDETLNWDEKGYSLSDIDDVDFDVLVPLPREDFDEEEERDEGAESDDSEALPQALLEKVLYVAACEGEVFTASLIRSYLGAGEDEVDDALDAMPELVEEGSYHEALGTWTYRFRHSFYRRWYRDRAPAGLPHDSSTVPARLGTIILQSYAPAAIEYIPKGAGLFVDGGDNRGARNLLALAMGTDQPRLVDFAIEIAGEYADSPQAPGLVRFVMGNSADRAVNGLPLEQAKESVSRAQRWAEASDEKGLLAFTQLLQCRILVREGKAKEARRAGEEALATFMAADDATRAGETLNQLAMIALNMGDGKGAERYLKQASKSANTPPVEAHSRYIHGLIYKQKGQISQAATEFGKAVERSTQSGNLLLALESMLNHAECSLMTGKGKDVAPMLERALEMSRAVQSPPRERLAARLLCQAEAARGRPAEALELARHALELTRQLGLASQEQVDLYHCGLFAVLCGKQEEGLDYLLAARAACEEHGDQNLQPEVLFNIAQVRGAQKEYDAARGIFEEALSLVRERNDVVRELRILDHLGRILSAAGDHLGAAARFKEAADRAVGPQAKEFRKALRKRIQQEQNLARTGEA